MKKNKAGKWWQTVTREMFVFRVTFGDRFFIKKTEYAFKDLREFKKALKFHDCENEPYLSDRAKISTAVE